MQSFDFVLGEPQKLQNNSVLTVNDSKTRLLTSLLTEHSLEHLAVRVLR